MGPKAPRLLELTEAPEFGLCYMVPSVYCFGNDGPWGDIPVWIPVHPEKHCDPEIGFSAEHYHLDWRFIEDELMLKLAFCQFGNKATQYKWDIEEVRSDVLRYVVIPRHIAQGPEEKLQRCIRMYPVPWTLAHTAPERLEKLLGKVGINQGGRCPHKGLDLSREVPNEHGHIMCPGHGLCFRADTGELIPRKEVYAAMEGGDRCSSTPATSAERKPL